MEWFTHPLYSKYEVNYKGIVRNRRTSNELKSFTPKNYKNPIVCVYDFEGSAKHKPLGSFVLEAINHVRNVDFFKYIDGDSSNNSYYNLKQTNSDSRGKKVVQISLTGSIVKIWDKAVDAYYEEGFNEQCICMCCKKKSKTHAGYYWCYFKDLPTFKIDILVAYSDSENNYFGSSADAFDFIKKIRRIEFTIQNFRSQLSKYKNTNKELYGYKWKTISREIDI